ncbi:hypothetical protein GCM10011498_11110 [Amylibacter cionae]|uniref:Uncharacterized protein n=1 Tax=Neptunicoccus cionae TaxID=2035344 RepID=A0A916QTQ2_9RHOB|nr:hypothetical protein GCM10011498_11110 [Amylibacter cionae]
MWGAKAWKQGSRGRIMAQSQEGFVILHRRGMNQIELSQVENGERPFRTIYAVREIFQTYRFHWQPPYLAVSTQYKVGRDGGSSTRGSRGGYVGHPVGALGNGCKNRYSASLVPFAA